MIFQTIKKRSTFVKINANGTKYRTNSIMVLCLYDNNLDEIEVGYTASKKVGNAVARNYAKRRMRHIAATLGHLLHKHHRYVFVANKNTISYQFCNLVQETARAIRKISTKK